jgi:hypothetical protein
MSLRDRIDALACIECRGTRICSVVGRCERYGARSRWASLAARRPGPKRWQRSNPRTTDPAEAGACPVHRLALCSSALLATDCLSSR